MRGACWRVRATVARKSGDGKAFPPRVEDAFGADVDFAQLIKVYGTAPEGPEVRYSPAVCMGTKIAVITGQPEVEHISTSYVERANLTMRMGPASHARVAEVAVERAKQRGVWQLVGKLWDER